MKKAKIKKYVIIGTITTVLGILSFMMYQSYAYFKVNYTGNIINTIVGVFGSYEYAYTGSVQEFTVPATGYYEIELWGAQGGVRTYPDDAKGGYTKGEIYLEKNEEVYIYVGDVGKMGTRGSISYGIGGVATFNGGGPGGNAGTSNAQFAFSNYIGGNSGGGATDIRLVNGAWNNSTSLRSRIMVAGGGGGSVDGSYDSQKGFGGGLIGQNGGIHSFMTGTPENIPARGKGGTQTSGGAVGDTTLGGTVSGTSGQFALGGNGSNSGIPTEFCHGHCGGGGGYYGGGGGQGTAYNCHYNGGGGGSSYISGYSGVNSVQETGGTAAQPLHTNNTIHYSGKYFIKGNMEVGVNEGNGKAKITYIGTEIPERTNTNLDDVRYIKNCVNGYTIDEGSFTASHWVEIQAIKDGTNIALNKTVTGTSTAQLDKPFSLVVDGSIEANGYVRLTTLTGIQCLTIDLGETYDLDEVSMWLYYANSAKYHDNVLSVGATNVTGTASLSTILHNYLGTDGYAETQLGKRHSVWD